MRGDLERLLYSRIEDRVEVRLGTSVDSFEQDGSKVREKLTDGTTGSFDLLVGADGVHSRVRNWLSEQKTLSRDFGLHGGLTWTTRGCAKALEKTSTR